MLTGRKVALAIGISDARPLPHLQGAINGARGFHEWALASGYDSRLAIDEDGPVTIETVKAALEPLIASTPVPVDRVLIYFAGHGLIRDLGQGLWLLSKSLMDLRAVGVDQLRHRLRLFGVRQVGIFADACRTLPADVSDLLYTEDGVIGRGPMRDALAPQVDQFIAAQEGAATIMIPGKDPVQDQCVFSGVLLRALWGKKPSAFSARLPGKITSSSIGTHLETEVAAIANHYKRRIVPNVHPAFREPDDVYYGDQPLTAVGPTFVDWPPLEEVQIELGTRFGRNFITAPIAMPAQPSLSQRMGQLQAPTHYETGCGFALEGATVAAVWVASDLFAEKDAGGPEWWRIGQQASYQLHRAAPALIELTGQRFVATTLLPGFIASILCDEHGAKAVVYRQIHGLSQSGEASVAALDRLESRDLRPDDVMNLAVELRQGKHGDPVLGVVSAYLYDSVGDIDGIRRMAWAYQSHSQPVPFELALLGHLRRVPGPPSFNGPLKVHIHGVPAREPRTEREKPFTWTYEPTPPAEGAVAGFWPLLRQGWTFLDDLSDAESSIVHPALPSLLPHLTRARFATLNAAGGQRLAGLFDLMPRPPL